ncbi:alpha/beta hydrolase fold [Parvibaculum lavamentivorans DS-1]|uniref:Alpha/beta hydrolase fold n=1 Tax=Parvibaculum lavamentivorans (strain DS-1 / DSM 13023 / NCIMB 13966) TaxID=402881 RepID=A7HPJ4_PARL1|nr:alpha/beta hydrolase [Parvibaculum lavamentivorans]ABS61827.1 alpha/beta hydrolase fold [Parvibaculum lavamentivorans DS-1]
MTDSTTPRKLDRPGHDGSASESLACLVDAPRHPSGPTGLTWLGGFKSEMTGTKAAALADWARAADRHLLRFDYYAHGASSGDFARATVTRWLDDALCAIDALAQGPQVLIGSSMGGWMALLAALARPERVKALVLIAPAPDFTEELMWKGFSDEIKSVLARDGIYREPSDYSDEPYEITMRLIEDGRNHLLLGEKIPLAIPVRILQGMADPDVPWQHAMRLVDALASSDVTINLAKSGDHRLSTPVDLARLTETIEALLKEIER